jgi:hypothetical protein
VHRGPAALSLLKHPTDPRELTTAPENSVVMAKQLDTGVLTHEIVRASNTVGSPSIEGVVQQLAPLVTKYITTTAALAGTIANIVGPTTHWAD